MTRFGAKSPMQQIIAYNQKLANALAEAIVAVREPDREAKIYCRDIQELYFLWPIALHAVSDLGMFSTELTLRRFMGKDPFVLEMNNGSAIIFLLEEPQPSDERERTALENGKRTDFEHQEWCKLMREEKKDGKCKCV